MVVMSAVVMFPNAFGYEVQPSVLRPPSSMVNRSQDPFGGPDEVTAISSASDVRIRQRLDQMHASSSQNPHMYTGRNRANVQGPSDRLIRTRSDTASSDPSYHGTWHTHFQPSQMTSTGLGSDPQLDWIVDLIEQGERTGSGSSHSTVHAVMQASTATQPSGSSQLPQWSASPSSNDEHSHAEQPWAMASTRNIDAHASNLPANSNLNIGAGPSRPSASSRPSLISSRRATMPAQHSNMLDAGDSSLRILQRVRGDELGEAAPACDFCRRRKVKCDRKQPQCSFCTKHGIVCTQTDQLRKRGPPTKDQRMALERAGLKYDRSLRRLMPVSTSSPSLAQQSMGMSHSGSQGEMVPPPPSVLSTSSTHSPEVSIGDPSWSPPFTSNASTPVLESGPLALHPSGLPLDPHQQLFFPQSQQQHMSPQQWNTQHFGGPLSEQPMVLQRSNVPSTTQVGRQTRPWTADHQRQRQHSRSSGPYTSPSKMRALPQHYSHTSPSHQLSMPPQQPLHDESHAATASIPPFAQNHTQVRPQAFLFSGLQQQIQLPDSVVSVPQQQQPQQPQQQHDQVLQWQQAQQSQGSAGQPPFASPGQPW